MQPTDSAVIVPVPEAEAVVGRFRADLDRAAGKGVPAHVTVLATGQGADNDGLAHEGIVGSRLLAHRGGVPAGAGLTVPAARAFLACHIAAAISVGAVLAGTAGCTSSSPAIRAAHSRPGAQGPGQSGQPGRSARGHVQHGRLRPGLLLPDRVYAPYFESWTNDRLPVVAAQSGARYFTLAFLQAARPGSCVLTWNGSRRQTIARGRFVSQIATLRSMGGDVIPSFGGYGADNRGTEIADSCTSVRQIASGYESVVTRYRVTRLDMDVEGRSLTNKAGIARRSEALRLLQQWAARTHHRVQIVFTLGVEPGGLPANCLAVLRSAVAHKVRLRAVNIMAFDYYNNHGRRPSQTGTEALSALRATHSQLASIYPRFSDGLLWRMEGITLLPGIDDVTGRTEVTYPGNATAVLDFARTAGLPLISIWAIQRDNGGCPGVIDSNSCSGIRQPRWEFSHLLESYPSR